MKIVIDAAGLSEAACDSLEGPADNGPARDG